MECDGGDIVPVLGPNLKKARVFCFCPLRALRGHIKAGYPAGETSCRDSMYSSHVDRERLQDELERQRIPNVPASPAEPSLRPACQLNAAPRVTTSRTGRTVQLSPAQMLVISNLLAILSHRILEWFVLPVMDYHNRQCQVHSEKRSEDRVHAGREGVTMNLTRRIGRAEQGDRRNDRK